MRHLIVAVLSWGLTAGSALAADMATKSPPPPPPPALASSWTGCYVNGGGGYGMWNQDHTTALPLAPFPIPTITSGGRGAFGTVGGGCDYQFSAFKSNLVIGAMADFDLMNLHGTYQDPGTGFGSDENERDAWAIGARIGYLVTPSLLTYINGGYTETRFAGVNYTGLFTPVLGVTSGAALPGHTYTGGFIGGGTEYALGWLPGLFLRNEYRYASYRAADLTTGGTGVDAGLGVHAGKDVQTISTELVYRFGWTGQPGSAPALGLALKARAAPPPPAASWTGCYVDGGAGYGMWNQDGSETALGFPVSSTTTNGGRGWFGTAGGGCDYQFKAFNNWNLVAGPFGDFDLMNSHGVFENPSFGATGGESERSAWAIGGRLGYLIGPPLLAYMNGGFSQTKFDSVSLTSLGAPAGSFPSHMYDGWFVGGGTEYALTWLPGLFWRNEYRFASYRSADLPLTPGFFPGLVLRSTVNVQTIGTALVYKFNWAGTRS
jgi:outer membrane immunogenic protein